MKIIVDENLPDAWIPFLRFHGVESSAWESLGKISAPDEEICGFAALHGFVILTRDLDFGTYLVKHGLALPSVIQIRTDDVTVQAIGAQVIEATLGYRDELLAGALVTVEHRAVTRTKLNLLPMIKRRSELA